MKKLNAICLFIFCFLISNSELFGQWRFGPQVGLNYSTTTDAYDTKFGTNFGGVVQYEFDLSFSLYQRVLYSNKGSIKRFDFGGNLGELDF